MMHISIPLLSYFDWHDPENSNHMIRFYCRTLTRPEADELPVGNLDNDSDEMEARWLPWRTQLQEHSSQLRMHITPGLLMYADCLTGQQVFDGTHQF